LILVHEKTFSFLCLWRNLFKQTQLIVKFFYAYMFHSHLTTEWARNSPW